MKRPRGRPRIASAVSQIPACIVPAYLHDAIAKEALVRRVSVAQVVRDALFSHLKNIDSDSRAAQ